MSVSRRIFIRDGVATVTLGLAAPSFLSAIAHAQGNPSRRLVVVYLGGGNDSLNTLIGYRDAAYYSRRPSIAVPAGQVLQVGTDASGMTMGLHPRLGGLLNIFNEGRLALVQRTGYPNSSRSHFEAGRYLGHREPAGVNHLGLARSLSRYAASSARRAGRVEHDGRDAARAPLRDIGVPAIPNATTYTFGSPNRGSAALQERAAAQTMANNPASGRPSLAFLNSASRGAIETLDRVAQAGRIHRRSSIRTTGSHSRCAPSRARSCAASAHACIGSRPAATTRTRARAEEAPEPTGISWARWAMGWGRSTPTSATRAWRPTRPSSSSPNSAGACPRTAAQAPITERRA